MREAELTRAKVGIGSDTYLVRGNDIALDLGRRGAPEITSRERRAALERKILVAHESLSDDAVIWYPRWISWRPTEVISAARLIGLIARLEKDEYGGVMRHGNRGPWAQVRSGGDGRFLVELHAHAHDGLDDGMYFERVIDVSAADVSAICWAWVRRESLSQRIELEPRVVPPRSTVDVAL